VRQPALLETKRASTLASNSSTEPERFLVGRLGRPHGLDGFLGLYIEEEDAAAIQPGASVFVDDRQYVVRAIRRADRGYQVAFEGIRDRVMAEEIRGSSVSVDRRRELGEGEFWPEDLMGLAVFDQDGSPVGTVSEVVFGSGQDRLSIERPGGPTFEVPFVDDLVPVVDLARSRVEIVMIPGLTEP
jgi:16S rRNA processing protein RimM